MLDLNYIEKQLKKRLPYKNKWYRKQNNLWDRHSSFIYSTMSWDDLVKKMEKEVTTFNYEKHPYFYYTVNRWYNYWSARAVEQIFTQSSEINANPNPKQGHYDFSWKGIKFDHKTSVFPKGFRDGNYAAYTFAKANPETFAVWFYKNQSTGHRFHLENRLFIVVYATNGEHYALKAEIGLLKDVIQGYINTFDPIKLIRLNLQTEQKTLTDIIWAVR